MVNQDNRNAQLDQVGAIYYNRLPTISRKTELALEQELAGVMIWELGQDFFEVYSLLDRIAETIEAFFATTPTPTIDLPAISAPYPNPVADILNFKLPGEEELELSVYTDLSRQLFTNSYSMAQRIKLDMNPYPAGVYLITLKTASAIRTFKVVKS